ncbi:alpha/beta fold hydrolase [Aliiglaciecola aliphaticivorans]
MIKGYFLPCAKGNLFVSQYGQTNSQKTILLLPSIFEELNLSRAILTKQALFLAKQGYCVYALDYLGTGDSEQDIEQVNVAIWRDNIVTTVKWLQSKDIQSITLWGVRFGGLMALTTLQSIESVLPVEQILLWKPVMKGKQFMTQFLRLKQANSMMQGEQKVNWRERILSGTNVEVAGYEITADLLSSIDSLEVSKALALTCPLTWFELASASIPPAVSIQTKEWDQQLLKTACFEGSAFWQIPEIFEQSQLHLPTLNALQGEA